MHTHADTAGVPHGNVSVFHGDTLCVLMAVLHTIMGAAHTQNRVLMIM